MFKSTYRGTGKTLENKWENAIFQRSRLPTRFMLELQKLLIKYSNKGVRLLIGSFPFFKTCSSLHEMMVEDWVRLSLGMRLQLGVLRYYSVNICPRHRLSPYKVVRCWNDNNICIHNLSKHRWPIWYNSSEIINKRGKNKWNGKKRYTKAFNR